jgi:hypothetical protein
MTVVEAVSDVLPGIPLERREILFPRMTEEQLARVAFYGTRRSFRAGDARLSGIERRGGSSASPGFSGAESDRERPGAQR